MKLRFVFLPLAAALALPSVAWAQAAGESAAVAAPETPPGPVQPGAAPAAPVQPPAEAKAQRSALWISVEAHHRQGAEQALEHGRRLTPAQLRELREQVRQVWRMQDSDQTTASAADRLGGEP